jgi:3-oxoacyl-[acyl-carrier protein] reductase
MKKSVKGKVAIITGASAGIGRAVAVALAAEGARCVLAARRAHELSEVCREIEGKGGEAVVVPTDVAFEPQIQALVAKAVEKFGGIDFLINNAGIYRRSKVEKLDKEMILSTFNINVVAPFLLTKYCLPYLKGNKGGAVINIASMAGLMGFAEGSVYSASKHALIGFSESLFEEVRADGIKVCAICPGFVKTPMVEQAPLDQEKMIPPEDVAQAVVDVLKLSEKSCPTRIVMRPQYSVYR